jgi:hypothetical protein
MAQQADFYIRTFQDGDEEGIIRVFEECYGEYAGYVLRTPEYWRWCCLERPDVERSGVFVAVRRSDEGVLGYAVAGKSGNIWEFGYDRGNSGRELVELLLKSATDYLEAVGASLVSLQVPAKDRVISAACANLGLAETKSSEIFVSVLDFQSLLFLVSDQQEGLEELDEAVEVVLRDAPEWMARSVKIRVRNGQVSPLEKGQKPTILVETDVSTLSSMLFGEVGPFWVWLRFSVRVKPFWKISRFLRLFSALRVRQPWFVPLSDYG